MSNINVNTSSNSNNVNIVIGNGSNTSVVEKNNVNKIDVKSVASATMSTNIIHLPDYS